MICEFIMANRTRLTFRIYFHCARRALFRFHNCSNKLMSGMFMHLCDPNIVRSPLYAFAWHEGLIQIRMSPAGNRHEEMNIFFKSD